MSRLVRLEFGSSPDHSDEPPREAHHDEAQAWVAPRRQAGQAHDRTAAAVFRDPKSWAEIVTRSGGGTTPTEPAKLIVPDGERSMATDRAFAKGPRNAAQSGPASASQLTAKQGRNE